MAAAAAGPTLEACRALPKVELHAHLNGSIRQEKLVELLRAKQEAATSPEDRERLAKVSFDPFPAERARDLKTCFTYFDTVYAVVDDAATLRQVCLHVIEDFHADGCAYLELRTTARAVPRTGLTTDIYMQTVAAAIRECSGRLEPPMEVRVLLSINRGDKSLKTEADAEAQVADVARLARAYPELVVGVDIGGNPTTKSMHLVCPAVRRAREPGGAFEGLPLTCHICEVEDDEEAAMIVRELQPERLGHACFLPGDLLAEEKARGVLVELCPSSNMATTGMKSMEAHHLPKWWPVQDWRIAICTDDTGLFSTHLSAEVKLAADRMGWSLEDCKAVQLMALDGSFLGAKAKQAVRARILGSRKRARED